MQEGTSPTVERGGGKCPTPCAQFGVFECCVSEWTAVHMFEALLKQNMHD